MRRIVAVVIGLVLSLSSLTWAAEAEKAPKAEKAAKEQAVPAADDLKTSTARLSYAVGMDVGGSLKEIAKMLDLNIFFRGLKDTLEGKKPLLADEQVEEIKQDFMKRLQAERTQKNKDVGDKNRKEGETFLAENKKKKGVVATDSGLQYEVLKEGDGPKPTPTDTVTVNYRGTLIDGTEFDSSFKRNEPATFKPGQVIPGWTETVQLMKVGSKYRVVIPSNLAYGERGAGPAIGPNAVLIFEVELLKTEK